MNEWWGAQNPDEVYLLCVFDWSDLGWPMPYATSINSVYYDFANGWVPFFAVIGAYNIYMYGENEYQAALDMVPDAIDSFNYLGVLNPIPPHSIYYEEIDTFDLNNVFGNPTGEPLTVALQGNTNPDVVDAEVTNNILTLTAQNISGNSTISLLATAGTQNFEYDFPVVVCGQTENFVLILDLDTTPTGSTLQASIENCYAGGDVHIISDPMTFSGYPLANTDAVFVLLGISPNNSVLREYQVGSLVSYIEGGGNVYLEGSNTWWRDPYFFSGYNFSSLFGINSNTEFPQDILTVDGHDFLDGMSWTYSGENDPYSVSQVEPIAPAVTIFSNPEAGYNCGVAYDSGIYNTVGTNFEITGLGGATNSLDDAVGGIIDFFGIACSPLAPAQPTDFVLEADTNGDLFCDISWTNPSTTFSGEPLTELLEMRLYRNGELIYTDTNPTIGGPDSYNDVLSVSGLYTYRVAGYNSLGEGLSIYGDVWVGEDVPNVVEDLLLVNQDGNGYLSWTNPTTGFNGGAFNEPILGYHIERSDGITFEIGEIATSFLDDTIPGDEYYSYDITPYNSVGDGGIATSNTVWIGEGFSGIVIFDFDPTPTGATLQASIENFYAGSVVVTDDINSYPITSEVDAVFVLLGVYSSNFELTETEASLLILYLDGGGNVYMEGGDTWCYDTQTSVHPYFNIDPLSDGSSDLLNVDGHDFLDGLSWTYTGENSYIDQLAPIEPAVAIFSNPTVGYDCGIAYDSGTYKIVGTSFEITGLGGTNSLDDAVSGIIDFFEIGGVDTDDEIVPVTSTSLNQNYPNPFNPTTTISFSILRDDTHTELTIFNIKGQKVKGLVNDKLSADHYSVVWDGKDDKGISVSSGVYFYKMKTGEFQQVRKMMLLK